MKAKDSYSLVFDKVKQNQALKKQQHADSDIDLNISKGINCNMFAILNFQIIVHIYNFICLVTVNVTSFLKKRLSLFSGTINCFS